MIHLDPRRGSGDLLPLFPPNTASLRSMDFGDAAWLGNGPDDSPVLVGAEIKRLEDVLQCIGNGRFIGHQLPGLVNSYNSAYLIVEGVWKRDREGVMVTPRRRGDGSAWWVPVTLGYRNFMVRDFEGWLTTVEQLGGIKIRRSQSRQGTVAVVMDLYHWWTAKEYNRHRSLCAFDNSQSHEAPMLKPGLVRRVAAQLPGIGWERSHYVAATFPSVREMANAREEDWAAIKWQTRDGRNQGIGMGIAKKVVAAMCGGDTR